MNPYQWVSPEPKMVNLEVDFDVYLREESEGTVE